MNDKHFLVYLIDKIKKNKDIISVIISSCILMQAILIEEASQYFGIGEKTLRRFVKEHMEEDFIICKGAKVLIKRKVFEKYIDESLSVL